MEHWNESRVYAYLSWGSYSLASCTIVYLLLRHALLVTGQLQPDALECGQCTAALIVCTCAKRNDPSSAKRVPKKKKKKTTRKTLKLHLQVIYYCTFGSLVSYLLFCVNGLLIYSSNAALGWLPFSYCRFAKPVSAVFYILAKCTMYSVFVARLHISFKDSAFGYGMAVINGGYLFIVASFFIVSALSVAFMRGERGGKAQTHFCATEAPVFYFPVALFIDVVVTVSVAYLFTAALRKLLKRTKRNLDIDELSRNQSNDVKSSELELLLLPVKYTVLSAVAILSTLTAVILFAIVGAYFVLVFDCVVNCATIVLMTGKWRPVYLLLCTPLLKCVAKTPCFWGANLTEAQLIELAVEKKKSRANLELEITTPTSVSTSGGGTVTKLSLW